MVVSKRTRRVVLSKEQSHRLALGHDNRLGRIPRVARNHPYHRRSPVLGHRIPHGRDRDHGSCREYWFVWGDLDVTPLKDAIVQDQGLGDEAGLGKLNIRVSIDIHTVSLCHAEWVFYV